MIAQTGVVYIKNDTLYPNLHTPYGQILLQQHHQTAAYYFFINLKNAKIEMLRDVTRKC